MALARLQHLAAHLPPQPTTTMVASGYRTSIQITPNTLLSVGDTLKLAERNSDRGDGDFLRLKKIFYNDSTGSLTLYGWILKRTRRSGGLIPSKLNEVYLSVDDVDPADPRPILEQALQTVDYDAEVYQSNGDPVKRNLILTNQNFPQLSFRERVAFDPYHPDAETLKSCIFQTEQLVCRWIIINYEQLQVLDPGRLPRSADVRKLTGEEADPGNAVPDWRLVEEWRGPISTSNRLTFADAFCGAGGVSVGASQAGLDVQFGFDYDTDACRTYGLNNPNSVVWNSHVDHFIAMMHALHEEFQVDILHMSPPCQAYSVANARVGRRDPFSEGEARDDANQAASFGISQLLHQCKPRVATMEQTSGILGPRSLDYFRGVVAQFTAENYSVSWRLLDLAQWGLPHHRKRVIIIASCPGGTLPKFPEPTHGPGTPRPFRTINNCICDIDSTYENHHPSYVAIGPPSSGDTLLSAIIATNGTPAYHPTGRQFTIRELAALMTLPLDFRFASGLNDGILKRQIGNMVPALFSKTLMRTIRKALARENETVAEAMQLVQELGIDDEELGWIVID